MMKVYTKMTKGKRLDHRKKPRTYNHIGYKVCGRNSDKRDGKKRSESPLSKSSRVA